MGRERGEEIEGGARGEREITAGEGERASRERREKEGGRRREGVGGRGREGGGRREERERGVDNML